MKEELFIQNLEKVYKNVEQEQQQVIQGKSSKSEKQLLFIMKELCKMKDTLDCHEFFPYYPKVLTDGWSYDDDLGNSLMELANNYRKL